MARRLDHSVRGLLHGSAALASVFGLAALLGRATWSPVTMASAIYGGALVTMYLTSAIYHSVPWSQTWKARWQMLDHTFIYALVAGTLTPLLVATQEGAWLISGLGSIWGLVALGFAQEVSKRRMGRAILTLQVFTALVALVPMVRMLTAVDVVGMALILTGGAAYLLGTILFVNSRPRLLPGVFSHHEFFHVVVIFASVIHFVAVWRVVVG